MRNGKHGKLLLESALVEPLRKLNRIRLTGATYGFAEGDIQAGMQALRT